jgi:hypothetical protein
MFDPGRNRALHHVIGSFDIDFPEDTLIMGDNDGGQMVDGPDTLENSFKRIRIRHIRKNNFTAHIFQPGNIEVTPKSEDPHPVSRFN